MRWPVERTWTVGLLLVALALTAIGINSGISANTEPLREPAGVGTIGCGSPWAPNYTQAEMADVAVSPQVHSLLNACRDHNDSEALVADSATPGGLLIALTMVGVIAFEARAGRAGRSKPSA